MDTLYHLFYPCLWRAETDTLYNLFYPCLWYAETDTLYNLLYPCQWRAETDTLYNLFYPCLWRAETDTLQHLFYPCLWSAETNTLQNLFYPCLWSAETDTLYNLFYQRFVKNYYKLQMKKVKILFKYLSLKYCKEDSIWPFRLNPLILEIFQRTQYTACRMYFLLNSFNLKGTVSVISSPSMQRWQCKIHNGILKLD